MTKIIEITGKMGAGKTTYANNLTEQYAAQGMSVLRTSFARPIKMILRDFFWISKDLSTLCPGAFNTTIENIGDYDDRFVSLDISWAEFGGWWAEYEYGVLNADPSLAKKAYRKCAQLLGTEIGRRTINENIWVDWLVGDVASAIGISDIVIIDDYRFPNEDLGEIEVFRPPTTTIERIRINTSDATRSKRLGYDVTAVQHESEAHIDNLPIDCEISGE